MSSVLNGRELERVRFFARQLMTAEDMTAEQQYFRRRLRRHNRFLHGWGVVCGCEVRPASDPAYPWRLRVCCGYVVTPQGDEILIPDGTAIDVAAEMRRAEDPCRPRPCPPVTHVREETECTLHLAIRYRECPARPVRVHPAGCGCDETDCEYSRLRDGFELGLLYELPDSAERDEEVEREWCGRIRDWLKRPPEGMHRLDPIGAPVPPCPPRPESPWVVLATLSLPRDRRQPIADIHTDHRRALYSTTALYEMLRCSL